jgi:flagellar motility protein MotE (MotC chaperone)
MLNGIKSNVKCSNKESFALFAKNDVNHTRDILFYMVAQNKLGNKAKINEIEKQLKIIDMEIQSKNSEELNNINQTYMKRISILNKDLLRKEQEINDLSDKYIQLKNEKDKIKYKAKNDLAMSIRVSTYIHIYNIVIINRLKNFLQKTQTLII